MPDYDFKALNDKEFEALCADLLSRSFGSKFERFKPGKDGGVDGRYFEADGSEVILQCKHWANTPISQLIAALKKSERPKLERLKPKRYIMAVSNALSRTDKKKIAIALSPYLIREDDIYGKEDLNDLLAKFPEAERQNYKLWLHSANVLSFIAQSGVMGRSQFSLDEIVQKAARYAMTNNHRMASKILNANRVLIISGDPGVGKTTLAEHLCLQYVSDGFQFVSVVEDIKEAEQVFSQDTKQIFYFDDFLGRNYLEALRGHEGGRLAAFIRRISANKLKRFVLTSRSTILNQGKFFIDAFENENLKRNECELRIEALTLIDKARILYNHIWHSCLSNEFREEFYVDKRYRKVISHKNFNPRIISFITDPSRRETEDVTGYWPYIERSLADPSQIWGHPFEVQLDESQRAIVLLVVLNRRRIAEQDLADAFYRLADRAGNQGLRGRHDFGSHVRLLTGSFLNRIFYGGSSASLDLFNPSIGDFLLRKYVTDVRRIRDGVTCLGSVSAVETVISMRRGNILPENICIRIFCEVLRELRMHRFFGSDVEFVAVLCSEILLFDTSNEDLSDALQFVVVGDVNRSSEYALAVVRSGLALHKISVESAIGFLSRHLEYVDSDDGFMDATAILSELPSHMPARISLEDKIRERAVEIASDSLDDFIEISDALSEVDWDDTYEAERSIVRMVKGKFGDLGIEIQENQARDIAHSIDIADRLRSYYENNSESVYRGASQKFSFGPDEVDDLFDRG